jgi:phospholipid transport system substrate-binding protein
MLGVRCLPALLLAGVPAPAAFASASTTPSLGPVVAGDCAGTPRPADPLEELRESDEALAAALKRHAPDWSPEAAAIADRIDRLLGDILDYRAIARQSLGAHWDTLTQSQQTAFLALFSPLTNGAVVSAAERRVSVTYDSETISGPEATVVVTPRVAGGAAGPTTRVEYKLSGHCGRWLIHDVVVDGVSLVDGYRAQFDRLFRRGSFDDLLAVMRRRLRRTRSP